MLAHDVAGASAPRRARPAVRRAGLMVLKAEVTVSEIHEEADAIFAVIDINGDGAISKKELTSHLCAAGYAEEAVINIFNKLDTNKDGELSPDEMRDGFVKFAPLRTAPGMGSYNSQFVGEIHTDADALFNAIDIDGNGFVSETELRVYLREFSKYNDVAITKLFSVLDINTDGDIERAELRDAFVRYSALRQAIGSGPNFK